MNIFYNHEENRLRAGLRIILYLFIIILFSIPSVFFKHEIISALVIGVLYFFGTWLSIWLLDNRSLDGIGLRIDRIWGKEFLFGAGMGFLAQSVIFLVEWQAGWLEIAGFGWQRAGEQMWLLAVGAVFLQMLSVGFYEELSFRGYLVRNLAEGFTLGKLTPQGGMVIAVVFTSVLFGLAHIGNPAASLISTLNIILAGFMLALPYVLTGRLALSVGIHFAWNFVMGGIYGLPVSGLEIRRSLIQVHDVGPALFTGGKFGPEAGIMGIIGMLLIVALILLFIKKTNGKIEIHTSFRQVYRGIPKNSGGNDELT